MKPKIAFNKTLLKWVFSVDYLLAINAGSLKLNVTFPKSIS